LERIPKFETRERIFSASISPPPNSLTIYMLTVSGLHGQERDILTLHTEIEKAAMDKKGDRF
jgi:hypothetical protein